MRKSIFFRLLGLGGIPRRLRPVLDSEGVVVADCLPLVPGKARRVDGQPRFTIHSFCDTKRMKTVCRISSGREQLKPSLVKELVAKTCFPESIVEMAKP